MKGFSLKNSVSPQFDEYILKTMNNLAMDGLLPVSVVTLFHFVKNDPVCYTILHGDIANLEHRRTIRDYDKMVPVLKDSLGRLRMVGMLSEPMVRD